MITLKIISIDDSSAVMLPEKLLEKLGVSEGDELMAFETPSGVELVKYNERVANQVEIAEKIMREDYEVLKKLAD